MYLQPWNVAALRGPVAAGALADAAGTLAGGPCLQKTGAGTLQLRAGTQVEVGGRLLRFTAAKAVEMPALVAGSDYAVWIAADGAVQASSNFVAAAFTTRRAATRPPVPVATPCQPSTNTAFGTPSGARPAPTRAAWRWWPAGSGQTSTCAA
jgi:hypothetical protein